jgi:CRP-like cAMP-binding protein
MVTPSPGNRLLNRLEESDHASFMTATKIVPLEFGQVLLEAHAPIEYAYFPLSGILSAVATMEDGDGIEVATIGKEGMHGIPAFVENETSPYRIIVQGAGEACRIEINRLKEELDSSPPLRALINRYRAAFLMQVSQCVACNGLHSIERRCCRWMLMTHDRLETDELPLTHEFLALMLGTRRSSVTEVLQLLQQRGLVKAGRGRITVLDRPGLEAASCECYATVQKEFQRLLD